MFKLRRETHAFAQIFASNLSAVREDQNFAICTGFDQISVQLFIIFDVALRLAARHFIERWLRNVEITALDNLWHLTIEEGQEQRPNVRPVDVSIGHDDNLVVAQFLNVEFFAANARAKRHDQRADLIRRQHFVEARPLHV